MLLSLAWRNLWRQRTRTVLSLVSIAFTCMLLVFMLSMQLGSYRAMKTNTLNVLDGFAQVQPEGYADDPDMTRFIPDAQALAARLERVDGISAATPRASAFVILANGETSYGAAVIGVDPAREGKVTRLPSMLSAGRYLAPADADAVVLGDVLARNLGVAPGDRVTLLGSAADRTVAADSLRVVGLFHSGIVQIDRQFAQMPLARFRDTFAMPGGANVIALSGPTLARVNRALPEVRAIARAKGLVAADWTVLQPALRDAITLDASTSSAFYASLVVVVVFIILNTLYMSVLERTREFGVLLAVGMRPAPIGRMMWIELILMAALGSAIGILLGSAVTLFLEGYGIPLGRNLGGLMAEFGLPSRLYPHLSPISALAGPLVLIAAVSIGGVVPYLRILRLEPIAAMGAA